MPLLQTIKAVAWSFVGLRNSKGLQEDTKLNPLHIVLVAIAAVLLFVGVLIAFVHWVVAP